MSLLQQIPFLNLSGPDFLNFYGAVAIAVLLATFIALRLADHTDATPPPVPQKPDAIQIAFLQGGVNQVVRTIVYDLTQRGFVALGGDDRVGPTQKTPAPGELKGMERRVLEAVLSNPKAHELFENRTLRMALQEMLAPARARLAAQDLLQPESVKVWKRRMLIAGLAILGGLAGAKFYVAFVNGRSNVSFLVFLSAAAICSLFALTYVQTRSVASRRGRAFLDDMRLAYDDRLKAAVRTVGRPGATRAFEGASLFLIGLYGFSVLKGTSDAMFAESFKRATGGSSCGGSCSGSCGDGDGGGGGFGGCGGD